MMEIFRLLDELEILLKDSTKVPFSSGKALVETDRFMDRLDRIRAVLPEELEQAKKILEDKERIYEEACVEAEQYVEQSRDKVARMVDDNEITRNAVLVAEEIIAKAEEIAAQTRADADEYADSVLAHMEMVLSRGLEAVAQGREELSKDPEEESRQTADGT
jgi:anion-transporting  ArsA/GET3 family ATPase